MTEIVNYTLNEDIAFITMDDGKANALSFDMIEALSGAFDRAEKEADAVVLAGRPGKFCAGFDLSVMMSGPDNVRKLLTEGTEILLKAYASPKPLVIANTGHAIAGGALLLATGDTRIGVQGEFKIGLNEVSNGMPLPILAHRLAQDRLDPRAFVESALQAKIYTPDTALTAGWLDRVTDPDSLLQDATAEAKRLAALPSMAYAKTKLSIRRLSIDHIRATLEDDFAYMLS